MVDTNAQYRAWVQWPHLYDACAVHAFRVVLDEGLLPEHKLLDVGCGSLGPGRYFIVYLREGNYTGLEPNKWLVREAIKHELGTMPKLKLPNWYHFDNWALGSLPERFDFILAHSIFVHTSQEQARLLMNEAHAALKDGGKFVASYYPTEGPNSDEPDWLYPAGVSYRHDFIESLATGAGLQCKRLDVKDHPAGHAWAVMTK